MHDYITKIHDHPAVTGEALLLSLFLMSGADVFNGGVGKGVNHAVAGAGADNKIVSKRNDVFQVYQDNVFSLFIFQGVYDFTSKFECVQFSPLDLVNGAENNFV
jgi:hypothetical protein